MRRLVFAALLAGCASSPRSQPPATAAGRIQRLDLAGLSAYALEDGHIIVPNDGLLLGLDHAPSETAELLATAGLPRDQIRLDIQCLLVKAGERVILFDAGTGEAPGSETGHLPASLALAHVAPSTVTDVFISHVHGDHVGGLVTKAGALAFPAATIHMSQPEWAAFQGRSRWR